LKLPEKQGRVFELDALRGLALLLMVLHHLSFDLRYMLQLNVFAFQETGWFVHLLQPFFLNVFLVVSGICCTFSRNNTRRGLRLLAVALGLTVATSLISYFSQNDFYIFFNVLHVLAVGTLLYAGMTRPERSKGRPLAGIGISLLVLMAVLIWLASLLPYWSGARSAWLLPLGIVPDNMPGMADFLPLIPWLGFFLLGAVIGRLAYAGRKSLFPNPPIWLGRITRPFEFIGRHSLLIYALHQPILLAVLYGLRALGWL
jgi:uncharacterized membrane protein